jgi:hypothetical protein
MRKLLLVLVACAVGVAFSLGFASRGHTERQGMADCARLVVPVNSDHNLSYDPQTGILRVEYYGTSGHLEEAVVDANDSACQRNPGIGRAIAHARAAARDVQAGDCAAFKAALNGAPLPAKGGVKPNLAAAKAFVEKEC